MVRGMVVTLLLATVSGCTVCPGPDDYTYSAFGGRWQRHDMLQGRVGSAFAPAGVKAGEDPAAEGSGAPTDVDGGQLQEVGFTTAASDDRETDTDGAPAAPPADYADFWRARLDRALDAADEPPGGELRPLR